MKLSIIIPAYNEINTLELIIKKVLKSTNFEKEIILVDDGSNDGTSTLIKSKISKDVEKVIYHKENLGKGAAIKSALKEISGDIVIIQDADLEYNPENYNKLIKPILDDEYKVVYGSRVLGKPRFQNENFISSFRVVANLILTIISNFLNSQNLTDAHTCYKVISKDILDRIELKENDFSFCPEITTKLSKLKVKIKEIPIDYNGRTYKEGKKISLKDGFLAIKTLFKYKFFSN